MGGGGYNPARTFRGGQSTFKPSYYMHPHQRSRPFPHSLVVFQIYFIANGVNQRRETCGPLHSISRALYPSTYPIYSSVCIQYMHIISVALFIYIYMERVSIYPAPLSHLLACHVSPHVFGVCKNKSNHVDKVYFNNLSIFTSKSRLSRLETSLR